MCFSKPKPPKAADPVAVAAPQRSVDRADNAVVKDTDVVSAIGGREASGRVGLGTSSTKRRRGSAGLVI